MSTLASPRPRLRGVSHQHACFVALGAGLVLVAMAGSLRAALAAGIYAALLAGMLGVSASYHRLPWGPAARRWWRRADHAMIFAFIAGTYTPIALLALPGPAGARLLALVWVAAALGVVRALVWVGAPRVITASLYAGVGWLVAGYLPEVRAAVDPLTLGLVVAGGALFTVGALVYATRRPDPLPSVFGFHEVFHAFVVAGCAAHFAAVFRIVRAAG